MSEPRRLGASALFFIAISTMIGSSWLFSAMYSAEYAGPAGMISVVFAGCVIFLIAMVFAELAGIVPVSGASARIPYATHGDFAAFTGSLVNWLGYTAAAPLEVMAVVEYLSEFLPLLAKTEHGSTSLTGVGIAVCLPLLLVMVVLNSYGVRVLARANTPLAVWKLLVPVLAIILFLATRFETSNFTAHGGFAPFGWSGVVSAVTSGGAILAFLGFRATVELAGEAHRPERTVPLVMLAAIGTTIIVYLLLSVAFIGALSPDQLANGWSGLSDKTGAGPFAKMAMALGLGWFAVMLFVDAAVSPSGTALVTTGVSARLNRAMALNGHAPMIFARLNRHGVPAFALAFNFLVGAVLLLPFPGWQVMMTLVSSCMILSLGLGSTSLMALRQQAPDTPRRYRLPAGFVVAALAFVLANATVYWAGWTVVRLLIPLALCGILLLPFLVRLFGNVPLRAAEYRALAWLLPWLIGLGAISFTGGYGGGAGYVGPATGLVLVALLSTVVLVIANATRLPAELARSRIAAMREVR